MQYISRYPSSAIFYIAILMFVVLFERWSERTNIGKPLNWSIIFILTLVAGFRQYSVGIDTSNYMEIYYGTQIRNDIEIGFMLIYQIADLINYERLILFIPAFFTYYFFFMGTYKKRGIVSLPWTAFAFMCLFYFESFNIMRQMLAMSIIYYYLDFLYERHDYKRFFIVVIIASLFHLTALSALLLIYLDALTWRDMPNRGSKLAKIFFLGIPIFVGGGHALLLKAGIFFTIQRKINYFFNERFNANTDSPGLMVYVRLLLFAYIAIKLFYNFYYSREKNDDKSNSYIMQVTIFFLVSAVIGTIISTVGYGFSNMDRMAFYLTILQIPLYGVCAKTMKKSFIQILVAVTLLYTYFAYIGQGISECMPYFP